MLTGRFGDTSGRPYLEGRIVIPRLNVDSDISFLVDTGADRMVIMPVDAARMGLRHQSLTRQFPTIGVGGLANNYQEPCMLAFAEAGKRVFVYQEDVLFAEPAQHLNALPSLLGRSILDRWRMVYDKSRSKLDFTVISADLILPV